MFWIFRTLQSNLFHQSSRLTDFSVNPLAYPKETMPLLHAFIEALKSLKIFTRAGACFWSCLPIPATALFIYFWCIYGAENDINQAVWSLVFGLRVLEIVYMVSIPMAILKLAPQTSVHTCLTHLKSPNRIVWASVPLLFAVAVLNSPLFVENDVNILFTAVNFFIMVYFTIFGAFTGMICKSFGVKCR